MQDAVVNGTGDEFFMLIGSDANAEAYQADGVISLSKTAFEFAYPRLSVTAYTRLTAAFTGKPNAKNNDFTDVSYNGMNLADTQADGKYVLASFDGTNWYYYERYCEYAALASSEFAYDNDTYFTDHFSFAFFAITTVTPANVEFNKDNPNHAYFTFAGNEEDIADKSNLNEPMEYIKVAPVAVTSEPSSSRLEGGQTYNAKVVFSENLKLANTATEPTIEWASEVEGATLTEFKWDGAKTITFTFTTATTYDFTKSYSFYVTNLVGVSSLQAPRAFGYSVVNNPVFGCPKIQNSVSVAYANTPALIAEDDLSTTEWTTADGTSAANLPYRLALVASPISAAKTDTMIDKIESTLGQDSVLSAQTFEVSLGLCSVQIAYVTGKRVKVFVPFPAGYTAESDVAFKAYHFKADGTPEEIDCVTTETGIIMMCDAFSPFAVVAVEAPAEKKVITVANGNGSFDKEIVKAENGIYSVTVTADTGYIIESLTLDGVARSIDENKTSLKLMLTESEVAANGSILEATFVRESIDVEDLEVEVEVPEPSTEVESESTTEPESETTTEPETESTTTPETETTTEPEVESTTDPENNNNTEENFFVKLINFIKAIFEAIAKLFNSFK